MKRGRSSEEQIIGILKQHEAGRKVPELAREAGANEATIYTHRVRCPRVLIPNPAEEKLLGGKVRSFPIERATLKNIRPILEEHIDPQSHLVTDESVVYYMMEPSFAKHSTVNHSKKEYARREKHFTVTTNTVESFFALLKRSNYGIHHHMSRKHLGQYCAECDFVYNSRKVSDDKRTELAIKGTSGKPLMLKEPRQAKM